MPSKAPAYRGPDLCEKPKQVAHGYRAGYGLRLVDQAESERSTSALALGRWQEHPVGPHRQAMYQVAFTSEQFANVDAELWTIHGAAHMDTLNAVTFADLVWGFLHSHPKPKPQ